MKKMICILLMCFIFMVGCTGANKKVTEVIDVTDVTDVTEVPEVVEVPDVPEVLDEPEITEVTEVPSEPDIYEEIELANQGMLEGIEFGLGDIGSDIEAQWGKPEDEGYFIGGYYMTYGDIVFLTDGFVDENNAVNYGVVRILSYRGEDSIFGINVGMTIEEISEIIGEPDYIDEYDSNEMESELYGQNWVATYNAGEFNLNFLYENTNAKVNTMLLEYQR